jgi:magnesium transporter
LKNPLQTPGFRALLVSGRLAEIRALCFNAHPADAAADMSVLDADEAWAVLETCDLPVRAEIFSHLDVDLQVDLSETLSRADLAGLLSEMSPDDRVDLILRLPDQQRETVLGAMARAEREDIRRLASFEEGTSGAVMTSDYVTLPPELRAGDAIAKIRLEAPNKETIYYAYVLDGLRRLIGFLTLKDLILAPPETRIADIMSRDVISANVADDQEKAARMIRKYDLLALPVVNDTGVLVGIVTHDDAMDILVQEQTEDFEKQMAIGGPHEPGMYLRTPVMEHFRRRVGWIMGLAALGLVSGFIVQEFEGLLLQFAILATFMPMLADTGGNTGSQSATLVVRALALEEVRPRDVLRVLFMEFRIALPLGLVLSLFAFARVLFFTHGAALPRGFTPVEVGAAVGTALGIQVVTSTLIGALLPLTAARLKVDPALVASPALTTVVDITGLLLYFTTVKLMLGL